MNFEKRLIHTVCLLDVHQSGSEEPNLWQVQGRIERPQRVDKSCSEQLRRTKLCLWIWPTIQFKTGVPLTGTSEQEAGLNVDLQTGNAPELHGIA